VSRAKVWEEVRRLNTELGMTIFLTTQYLEEADVLADRVGIIDAGHLVAEGTPVELKKRVGQDVIVARIGTDTETAVRVLRELDEVDAVDARHDELVISVASGAKTIGPIAIALGNADIVIRDLTLRTPTLDDVFLDLTGNRIEHQDVGAEDDSPAATDRELDELEAVR
jgi:ABC-2 type transport system ATP-binding protein